MKILINANSGPVADWLRETVGSENYTFDAQRWELTLHHDEDIVAYKLKFPADQPILAGYRSRTYIETGYYYCPYIPLMKHEKD